MKICLRKRISNKCQLSIFRYSKIKIKVSVEGAGVDHSIKTKHFDGQVATVAAYIHLSKRQRK